jgi:hypothetical protein
MPVLIQYAEEDGPITLHEPWRRPIGETLDLIEWILIHTIVGFNLSFDHFMLVKCYTIFRLCPRDWIPEEHINEIALLEPQAQDGPCIKPASALDLMLYCRKGPLQGLMARDDVRIKKIPTALAVALADELESRIQIDDIYFAKCAAADAPRWQVFDRVDRWGDLDPNFKDVVLRYSPAGGLKFLAEYVLKRKPKYHYKDVEPDTAWRPIELGYAPTALAISTPEKNWEVWADDKLKGRAWPGVIDKFINHWTTREDAREYATDDIVYTRDLDKHFGYPEPGDNDSVLACMVSAVRWHGFAINKEGMVNIRNAVQTIVDASPVNINKPCEVRKYVTACMDETEKLILSEEGKSKSNIIDSTKKNNLEAIANWEIKEREECSCGSSCTRCVDGWLEVGPHPAAVRSKEILKVKSAAKEVELFNKLILAGKFHASFVVIGTLSSRMSGADGLNAQGIKHEKNVRCMFPLAWPGTVLSIGDFASFEVTIADSVCRDPDLRKELTTVVTCSDCKGVGCKDCKYTGKTTKKIHGLFGQAMFPGKTYDEILASKETENDLYTKGKQGFFGAILYGGTWETLVNKLGVAKENAISAIEGFLKRYKGVTAWRERVSAQFSPMKQPAGIGTRVIWSDPAEYCETFLGFRRYYTLENKICKALFQLAQKPPKHWKDCLVKVVRRERVQTASGAVASALYGAAFQLQAANVRSAANHQIQSPGAEITKSVQRRVWDLQPVGVNDWVVCPMQVHDEVIVVSPPGKVDEIETTIKTSVEMFRDKVPLINIDWVKNANSWADK